MILIKKAIQVDHQLAQKIIRKVPKRRILHQIILALILDIHINENKTALIIKLMIMAAIYEFLYMHKIPIKVIINEYLKVSDFFIENSQKKYLNAILDKVSKTSRLKN